MTPATVTAAKNPALMGGPFSGSRPRIPQCLAGYTCSSLEDPALDYRLVRPTLRDTHCDCEKQSDSRVQGFWEWGTNLEPLGPCASYLMHPKHPLAHPRLDVCRVDTLLFSSVPAWQIGFLFSSTRSELTLTRPREKHARIHGSGTQCGIWDRGDFLMQTPSTIIMQRGRSVFVPKSSGQRDSSLRRKQSRTAHTTKTAEFILSRRFLEVQEIV